MNIAEAVNELVGNHQYCLEREFAAAKVEEIFQTWAEEIKNHNIVVVLFAVPVDAWNASPAGESLVEIDLIFECRKFHRVVFKLDCYFFAGVIIQSFGITGQFHRLAYVLAFDEHTEIDSTIAAATNLSLKTVFTAHAEILHCY